MPKILTLCGSLRTASFNRALINALPSLAPSGMSFFEAPPIETIPHYNFDLQSSGGIPAPVSALADAVRISDGVIIVTPEYNWTIPGALKNALDWVSRVDNQPFSRKPVVIQSVTGGPLGGARMQYHMRMCLTFLNSFVFGTPEVFVGLAHTKFDPATFELKDEATRKIVAQQLEGFAAFISGFKTN